jgi:Holliday junction resolvase
LCYRNYRLCKGRSYKHDYAKSHSFLVVRCMSVQYHYGRRKEYQTGEFLKRRGFFWYRSPGSRGAGDIVAKKRNKVWFIQVKATRKDQISYTRLTIHEEEELIKVAKRYKADPILALVSRNFVGFFRVPE